MAIRIVLVKYLVPIALVLRLQILQASPAYVGAWSNSRWVVWSPNLPPEAQ